MALIVSLLVTDNSIQQYFVDKTTGAPLANGIVTFYVDDGGTTLKNIYTQTGPNGGPYSFVTLPNPLRLSSVGTPVDSNGNDVELFYYPYDEASISSGPPRQAYHVKVQSSSSVNQEDRYNFPYNTSDEVEGTGVPTNQNLIVNNEFWRNVGTSFSSWAAVDPVVSLSHTVIAPSQHDSFYYPDIQLVKNNLSATDTVSFNTFTAGGTSPILSNDITPEYYLDYVCTVAGSNESKYVQLPISLHLLTLGAAQNCCFTIQMNGTTGPFTVPINIYSHAGTGGSGTSTTNIANLIVQPGWSKYTVNFNFPPSLASGLGVGGDDAFYLQIGLPLNTTCTVQMAKPSIYLNTVPPTNEFSSYDVIDAVVNSPRTGDILTSLNAFSSSLSSPMGWAICNDQTIGSAASTASIAKASTWPLYNLLWNSVNDAFATVATGRGASAYADFNSNKNMSLPLVLGRSLLGLPPAFNVTSYSASAPAWSGTNGFFTLATASVLLYVGMPVILTGTSLNAAFTSGNLYYVIPAINGSSTTQFQLASSYANALAGTAIAASGGATGTSIVITAALAGALGEATHVQLSGQVGAHSHTATYNEGAAAGVSDSAVQSGTQSATGTVTVANNTPASYPMNIVQPSVYMNVFLKL